jgi:hypothetical protein
MITLDAWDEAHNSLMGMVTSEIIQMIALLMQSTVPLTSPYCPPKPFEPQELWPSSEARDRFREKNQSQRFFIGPITMPTYEEGGWLRLMHEVADHKTLLDELFTMLGKLESGRGAPL